MRFKKGLRRLSVPAPSRARSRMYSFPAPVRGWVANENLAAAGPQAAHRLENFFPTTTGVRLRGGSRKRATVSTGPVTSLWSYVSGASERFFAADANNIFDITSVSDPDTIPAASVSGQTNGHYSVAQMGSTGGEFLYALNGSDSAQLFDGTNWSAVTDVSTPSITGVTTSESVLCLGHCQSFVFC